MANSIYENTPNARQADPPVTPTRFRPRYRVLTPEEHALHDAIKDKAAELEALFDQVNKDGRYKALAITSLEQSVMWIIKGLTA
jgi:hypothetical protein